MAAKVGPPAVAQSHGGHGPPLFVATVDVPAAAAASIASRSPAGRRSWPAAPALLPSQTCSRR